MTVRPSWHAGGHHEGQLRRPLERSGRRHWPHATAFLANVGLWHLSDVPCQAGDLPVIGAKRTSRLGASRSEFDPYGHLSLGAGSCKERMRRSFFTLPFHH